MRQKLNAMWETFGFFTIVGLVMLFPWLLVVPVVYFVYCLFLANNGTGA